MIGQTIQFFTTSDKFHDLDFLKFKFTIIDITRNINGHNFFILQIPSEKWKWYLPVECAPYIHNGLLEFHHQTYSNQKYWECFAAVDDYLVFECNEVQCVFPNLEMELSFIYSDGYHTDTLGISFTIDTMAMCDKYGIKYEDLNEQIYNEMCEKEISSKNDNIFTE